MKIIIDLERLKQYFEPTGPWDLHKKNDLSYRQNHRDAHHLKKLGLIEVVRLVPSRKRGKDKVLYQITPFGKEIYHRFRMVEDPEC